MKKPIYVLGTGLSHDGSTCLLKDGKIIVAIEKERLSRKKHDGHNDNLTIQYCLDYAGITFNDIDLIVEKSTFNKLKPEEFKKRSNRIIPEGMPITKISHHLAHAYSVIGTSPYDEMSIVVMDGQGCSLDNCIEIKNYNVLPEELRNLSKEKEYLYWERESYYAFVGNKMAPIFKDFSKWKKWDREKYPAAPFCMEHSVGEFYAGISAYIFDSEWCEGKMMGLAPYGRPGKFNFQAFELKDGRAFLKYDWMQDLDPMKAGKYQCFSEYFQYYADLAYWGQKQVEEAILYLFNSYYDKSPHKNIGYAGGVALNAVVNSKIIPQTKFKNLYIQPAAGDNGLSIGCCYYGWLEVLGKEKVRHDGSTYFGRSYNKSDIEKCLDKYNNEIEFYKTDLFCEIAANVLSKGDVVGWFQGGSEFGPRALGHRSILGDPRRNDIRNFINRKIKSREDFRPFAPSICLEDANICFDNIVESPYMILVSQTKEKWREKIPGAVHKDGSARVQTVTKKLNPEYYELIQQFKKLTNIPVVLNTSFNDRGMPMVETPEEAVQLFIKVKNIKILVIDNYIIKFKTEVKND